MIYKLIITGGRDYNDYAMVVDVLNHLNPSVVIQGGATGADALAREWALDNGKEVITYNADWDIHGKSAGPIRNKQMCSEHKDAILIAFQGGKGTENCVNEAVKLNMIVLRVEH